VSSEDTNGAASTICSKLSIRIRSRILSMKSAGSSSAPIAAPTARPTTAGIRTAWSGAQKTPSGKILLGLRHALERQACLAAWADERQEAIRS
jgi:hypothetical protein